eukprot:COSAG04_NODE_10724_length_757_cov_0.917933_2_plen_92_part_00
MSQEWLPHGSTFSEPEPEPEDLDPVPELDPEPEPEPQPKAGGPGSSSLFANVLQKGPPVNAVEPQGAKPGSAEAREPQASGAQEEAGGGAE